MSSNLNGTVTKYQAVDTAFHASLTEQGQVFVSDGSSYWQLFPTPSEMKLESFQFIDSTHAAVVGTISNTTTQITDIKQSEISAGRLRPFVSTTPQSINTGGILVAFTLIAIALLKKRSAYRLYESKILCGLIGVIFIMSCGGNYDQYKAADPNSANVTKILRLRLSQGFHHFAGNGDVNRAIAITNDGGEHWDISPLRSNFELRDVTSIGNNYFVANYAAANHPDGDVWIYGNDSTQCKTLARNTNYDPFHITCGRGLNGLFYDRSDSTWLAYGSEKITKFPLDENSSTDGNLLVFPANLENGYSIINLPGENEITHASKKRSSIVCVTSNGEALKFDGKDWKSISANDLKWRRVLLTDDHILLSDPEGNIWTAPSTDKGQLQRLPDVSGPFMQELKGVIYFCSSSGELHSTSLPQINPI